MYELKVVSSFSAAHHLLNYEGECENQHGHNWKVEVYIKGENLDKSNILVDFKVLKKELKKVLDYLDHTDINELPEFKETKKLLWALQESISLERYGLKKSVLLLLISFFISILY